MECSLSSKEKKEWNIRFIWRKGNQCSARSVSNINKYYMVLQEFSQQKVWFILTVAQRKNGIKPDDKSVEMASLIASGSTAQFLLQSAFTNLMFSGKIPAIQNIWQLRIEKRHKISHIFNFHFHMFLLYNDHYLINLITRSTTRNDILASVMFISMTSNSLAGLSAQLRCLLYWWSYLTCLLQSRMRLI